MSLSRVKTSGAMRVHAQLPEDSYAVILALSSEVEHFIAGEVVPVRLGCGLVQSPLQPVEVRTPENFQLFFLKFGRESVTQELEKLLQREINSPVHFSPRFQLLTEAGQRFRRLVLSLWVRLGEGRQDQQGHSHVGEKSGIEPMPDSGLTIGLMENALVALLLEAQRHNYTRLLARYYQAGPWQVRAAEDYMSANAHLPLSLGDICVAAGVGSRTLQHSFQRARGCTPTQFLRRLRMDRVRADLSQPAANATVTDTAARWGFLHFGRFAAEYQAQFGEKPSHTLHRARHRFD